MHDLPDPLRIEPRGPLDARVRVPGSKSVTNRALLVAALAKGESELSGALASDDTEVMIASLGALGCAIDAAGDSWRVNGTAGACAPPRRRSSPGIPGPPRASSPRPRASRTAPS